jgi:diguanylate cyclase
MQPASVVQRETKTGEKQAVRLRRFSLGASSYAFALLLLFVGHEMGFVHAGAALPLAVAIVVANAALYAAFRSGFNLRFADPSLTKLQVLVATTMLMAALYSSDVERGISLALCFLIFLFGIFRLSTRELVLLSLYACAGYALVINLLMHLRPSAIPDVRHEWFNWLVLAVSLPWFGVVGGRIRALRDRLRERNRELQDAIGTIHAMATR